MNTKSWATIKGVHCSEYISLWETFLQGSNFGFYYRKLKQTNTNFEKKKKEESKNNDNI